MRITTRRSARAAWWHYSSCFFSLSCVVKNNNVFVSNGKKSCLLFIFKKQQKRQKNWSTLNSRLHTKKKEKNSNHRHSFHHGAEFFLLEQRLVHEDIRADTSQRSRCVHYTLRALSLSFYFSLSRPRRTAGIIVDAFRGRDYISDWQTLLFSLCVLI